MPLTATGIATADQNFSEAAIPLFDEAVKLNPKNEAAYTKLGEIHDTRRAVTLWRSQITKKHWRSTRNCRRSTFRSRWLTLKQGTSQRPMLI